MEQAKIRPSVTLYSLDRSLGTRFGEIGDAGDLYTDANYR